MEQKAKIITVVGKGGVGKTSLCASIVRLLAERYPDKKILAIDADPAVGLSVALGVDVKLTLDDIRMSIVDSVENGNTNEALELLSEARFKIFDALVEEPGFAFLAIGRPESSGCYCKVNSYLKEVIGVLAKDKLLGNPCVANPNENMCNGCSSCEKVCPYGAITYVEKEFRGPNRTTIVRRVASVNEAVCQGCGACTVACPSGAMDLKGFSNKQIMAEVDALC